MSILQLCKIKDFNQVSQLLNESKYEKRLLDQQDHSGRCGLHYAVLSDDKRVCQQLLASGASPNIQDGQGHTPLHLALSQEKPNSCTQILCDPTLCQYNWSLQDAFGRTVLHWICAKGYFGLLTQIVRSDASPNENNTQNEEKKENESVDINKQVVAAFNLQNKSGQTCMHWAVDKKEWKCVQFLLQFAENGVLDLTIKDNDGLLAYDLCLDEHLKQLIWDRTKIQMEQKEKKAKENAVEKFTVDTTKQTAASSGNNKKAKAKLKGKGKKKMKIKLKSST